MSEFIEKLKSRRSVRSFKSEMPPKEVIDEIISAGLYAPSGMNRQPVIIVAVTNKEMRDRLSRMNAEIMGKDVDPFYNAPVVLIVLADKAAPTYLYDGTLVMENLMLAAHDEGLGSCWIHRAKEEFESVFTDLLLNKEMVLDPITKNKKRYWMVTTSDDKVTSKNKEKYLLKENSYYTLEKPKKTKNF